MPQNKNQLWFKSTLFEIEPGEDEATNPGCYGKSLANWLRTKLIVKGYEVEDIIPEDWGWCVMCTRKPFMLWVGCSSLLDYEKEPPEDLPPSEKDVTWTCFVTAELSLVARLFKRIDTTAAVEELFEHVKGILKAEPTITFTAEP